MNMPDSDIGGGGESISFIPCPVVGTAMPLFPEPTTIPMSTEFRP